MAEYTLADGTTITNASNNAEAEKASVAIIDAGAISAAKTIDFANGGCYKCTATGTLALTVANLGVGQTARVHILSGGTAPTLTWATTIKWVSATAPTFVADKLTAVTLFNDGTRIVGSFLKEA